MNGVHDMGGMHGFGPVVVEQDEPVFHETWEGRIFGIRSALPRFSLASRFAIERLDPALYLSSGYWEKRRLVMERALLDLGLLSTSELDTREQFYREHPDAAISRRKDPEELQKVLSAIAVRHQPNRDVGIIPRFAAGDAVIVRNIHPAGHTRLPRYVRGRQGVVVRLIGIHSLSDTDPMGNLVTAEPQPIYSVRFAMDELWGESAEPNGQLYIDMWESYLESLEGMKST